MADLTKKRLTGADFIADFISMHCFPNVFLVTGGACAFIVDALGRNSKVSYTCFQHEQAAAMAADSIWRTSGKIGVTLATSGPGATNLITGIACSWFDSIPSLHITGQVNQSESRDAIGANVRQAGFQETDIASMVSSITKWAKSIKSVDDLLVSLPLALQLARSGRMGPVLLDVPMNIQKEMIDEERYLAALQIKSEQVISENNIDKNLFANFFSDSKRPLVLIGAGAALSGTLNIIQQWCEENKIPYVASWGAMPYLTPSQDLFQGSIGVYGSRHANWCIQAADKILVLGSRLDNRQRTGNPHGFAPFASILVLDIDKEELAKYRELRNYSILEIDLHKSGHFLSNFTLSSEWSTWLTELEIQKNSMEAGFEKSTGDSNLNPYFATQMIQGKMAKNSIAVSDCGANLCWIYQAWEPSSTFLFTSGGNSPMGYSLPAAIGAQIANPGKKVYCFIGDGGLQMNIQELQTIVHYKLPIVIFIQNNFGYGIIKQFQDSYFEGRHFATGIGYSVPDFAKIANAYGIKYIKIEEMESLKIFEIPLGPIIIDLHFSENSLITPKTEMDRFIHDQFPYISDGSVNRLPFPYPERPSALSNLTNPTV